MIVSISRDAKIVRTAGRNAFRRFRYLLIVIKNTEFLQENSPWESKAFSLWTDVVNIDAEQPVVEVERVLQSGGYEWDGYSAAAGGVDSPVLRRGVSGGT